jgi:hypothetical protein
VKKSELELFPEPHLTEIATEIAQAKKIPADEIFKTLASLPREKVAEHVKKMI